MNNILKEFLDITVVVYLDNILIYTDGPLQQHIQDVSKVLDVLLKQNLKANLEKCEFYKTEVEFLGFIIGVNGIKIDLSKTNAISDQPILKNVKEVQFFLRLANYNRKFIKDYSKIAILLTQLTAKDTTFKWTSEC